MIEFECIEPSDLPWKIGASLIIIADHHWFFCSSAMANNAFYSDSKNQKHREPFKSPLGTQFLITSNMGSHRRFQGETTSASQLKFLLSTSRSPKPWVSPPPWALQKNRSKKWFGTNGFQPVEDLLLEKIEGRKWQQRKPESQHPQHDLDGEYITGIYGFQFQHHTCGRKTPRRRFQASKLCIYSTVWEIKCIQNVHKKKA